MKKIIIGSLLTFTLLHAQEAVKLDSISIVGSMDKSGGEAEYVTPRTIVQINQNRIKEEGVRQLDEAVRYEAGFSSQPYGSDLDTTDWLKLRGFDATLVLDGTALYKGGYWGWSPDMYGLEKIEIIKGANSLMYGSSQSGGLINLVSKRPTSNPQGEVGLTVGTQKEKAAYFDVSDSLSDKIKMRLVGNYQKRDGSTSDTWQEHYYIAPSLSIQATNSTLITLLGSFSYDHGVPTTNFYPAYGTIIDTPYGKITPYTNLGSPQSDSLERKQTSLGYEITHELNNNITLAQNYRFSQEDKNQFSISYFAMVPGSDKMANRSSVIADGVADTHTLDNRIIHNAQFDFLENQLIAGIDYQNIKVKGIYGFGYNVNPIDIFNPVHTPQQREAMPNYSVDQSQWGLYLQEKATLYKNLIFQGGVRYDQAKSTSDSFNTRSSYDIGHTTFQAGLLYNIESLGLMPFVNYSESFRPISGNDGQGNAYKPYEGGQYEVGIKYLPLFMDAEINISYFDLTEKNGLVNASNSPIAQQAGKQSSQGIEVSTDIMLLESLQWSVAYAHTKAKTNITPTQTITTPMIPENTIASKLLYTLHLGQKQVLKAGVGVRYTGKMTDEAGNPGITIPSYHLYDALIHYGYSQWETRLNITNLANKKYVSSCYYSCYYGEGLRASLNVGYTW